MKILEEKQNLLFKRKEVILEVEANTTPNHEEMKKAISEQFSIKPDTFKIKKIEGRFGSRIFKIYVFIYSSKEDKKDTEVKTKQEKELEKKILEEKLKAEAEEKKVKEDAERAKAEEKLKEDIEKKEKASDKEKVEEVKKEKTEDTKDLKENKE